VPLSDAVLIRDVSRLPGPRRRTDLPGGRVDDQLVVGASRLPGQGPARDRVPADVIPHPRSFITFSVEQVAEYVDALDGQAVVKLVHGSWGRVLSG
jgi:hypothetical protein